MLQLMERRKNMQFENVKQLAKEFEKLSGNRWEINPKTICQESIQTMFLKTLT